MKKLFQKAATSTANVLKDSATGLLSSVHFVTISIADGCEKLECIINKDVDPEQIRRDRMQSTIAKQMLVKDAYDRIIKRRKEAEAMIVNQFVFTMPKETEEAQLAEVLNAE